ncbi:pimeloyl-ACP methyl ester carboxylesterase [Saccharothrix tamanrassetensis]|uniref:Pimeloyl-ACP methyl ester carboxylesterase n=1 Tax=Saccharothrix tamanrassetensis TaxID=1051531 RepID=A0A841CVK9_9PSEU|nr:alpha/beta hydrolase [Saccharothrix tamanrassetensis]MBB5960057.1 pimeloyl-ACP methyl ester carboxylesterase [Saccharothrix tamanrassetensis]
MTSSDSPPTVVLLPGTASDEVFVRSAFARPLADAGFALVAPASRSIAGHLAALDAAWDGKPLVVGGVSLGAHVAAGWAVRHPERCAGVLAALPAWLGPAAGAPAASAASVSATSVDGQGLDAALDAALAGVDGWLGDELRRAWPRYGARLASVLRESATSTAPTSGELRGLNVPVGVAACTDDQVHPLEVAREWVAALPRAALRTTTLAALGADREALGRAALDAYLSVA